MQKEYRYTKLMCDICGKEVTEFMKASETSGAQILVTEIIPYMGQRAHTEICVQCNDALVATLAKLREKPNGE